MKWQDRLRKKSIYRVAEQLGVSIATVSRVVNNRIGVSETTRRKVLECIQQMGYKASCGNTRPKYVAVINFYPVPTEYNRKLLEALFIHFRLICAKSRFFRFQILQARKKRLDYTVMDRNSAGGGTLRDYWESFNCIQV